MRILLHTCCAPCMIHPLTSLTAQGHHVEGFFYNPNIHPCSEFKRRREAVEAYAAASSVIIHYPAYCPEEYFRSIVHQEQAPARCLRCWKLRLDAAAKAARGAGFDAFTSTLLVSPYQDHTALQRLGEEAAAAHGVRWHYEDFRPGFRSAHNAARAKGIYCQNYCGCLFSEVERCQRLEKRSSSRECC